MHKLFLCLLFACACLVQFGVMVCEVEADEFCILYYSDFVRVLCAV